MNLNISGCKVGIQSSGAKFKVSEITIKDCNESAVRVFWNATFNAQKIRMETCTIEKCFRPIVAEGRGLEIVVPSSCIIEGCSLKNETKGGAVIDWKNDPDPPVIVEAFTPQDNFSRYMKLMLGLGTDVLVKVLRKCYKSRTGKNWNNRTGREIASRMNDYQRSRLGKAMLDRLKEDDMDSWDITLLSALLVNNPGYMDSSSLERAVESLREQRNEIVHSASFKDFSMDHDDFRSKWRDAKDALESLIGGLLSSEATSLRNRISSIYNERKEGSSDSQHLSQSLDTFRLSLKELALEMQKLRETQPTASRELSLGGDGTCSDLKEHGKFTILRKARARQGGSVYIATKEGANSSCALKFYKCTSERVRGKCNLSLTS